MRNPLKPGAADVKGTLRDTGMARGALVPRIKHLAFERDLRERGIPSEHLPLFEPLVGELMVTYAFDLPDQFVMATPTNMARAGIALDEARGLSCVNLRSRLPEIQYVCRPRVFLATTGGNWEACLLLLDEVWQRVHARRPEGFVVCVPRRDRLLISEGVGVEAMAALRRAADRVFMEQGDAHALSLQCMTWQHDHWRVRAQ